MSDGEDQDAENGEANVIVNIEVTDAKKKRKPHPKTSIPARRRKTQVPPDLITR